MRHLYTHKYKRQLNTFAQDTYYAAINYYIITSFNFFYFIEENAIGLYKNLNNGVIALEHNKILNL